MRIIRMFFMVGGIILLQNCASIVSHSSYPVSISSKPIGAKVEIKNKSGVSVAFVETPATVPLDAGSGYFKRAGYELTFTKEGYDTRVVYVESRLDGWYFGNLLIGGLIGMLIVDPVTGAMYKLDESWHQVMTQSTSGIQKETLKIYALDEVPDEWKSHLVKFE